MEHLISGVLRGDDYSLTLDTGTVKAAEEAVLEIALERVTERTFQIAFEYPGSISRRNFYYSEILRLSAAETIIRYGVPSRVLRYAGKVYVWVTGGETGALRTSPQGDDAAFLCEARGGGDSGSEPPCEGMLDSIRAAREQVDAALAELEQKKAEDFGALPVAGGTLDGDLAVNGALRIGGEEAATARDLAALVGEAPAAYDTLGEVADWIQTNERGTAALTARVGALEANKADRLTAATLTENGEVAENARTATLAARARADGEGRVIAETYAIARNLETASALDTYSCDYINELHREALDVDPYFTGTAGPAVTLPDTPAGRYVEPGDYAVSLPLLQAGTPTPAAPVPVQSPSRVYVRSAGLNRFDQSGIKGDYAGLTVTRNADGSLNLRGEPTREYAYPIPSGSLIPLSGFAAGDAPYIRIDYESNTAGDNLLGLPFYDAQGSLIGNYNATRRGVWYHSATALSAAAATAGLLVQNLTPGTYTEINNIRIDVRRDAPSGGCLPYESETVEIAPRDREGNAVELYGGVAGAENTIEYRDGLPYYVRRTGKLVFDGSADEGWYAPGVSGDPSRSRMATTKYGDLLKKGTYVKPKALWTIGTAAQWGDPLMGKVSNSFSTNTEGSLTILTFYADEYSADNALARWKAYLAEHPSEFYFELETPVMTALDPASLPALATYAPETTFTVTSDAAGLDPGIDLTALSVRDAVFARGTLKLRHGEVLLPLTTADMVRTTDGRTLDAVLAEYAAAGIAAAAAGEPAAASAGAGYAWSPTRDATAIAVSLLTDQDGSFGGLVTPFNAGAIGVGGAVGGTAAYGVFDGETVRGAKLTGIAVTAVALPAAAVRWLIRARA